MHYKPVTYFAGRLSSKIECQYLEKVLFCMNLAGVTGGYRMLQEVAADNRGLQGVKGGYKVSQVVTRGYKGLQGITRVFQRVLGVTRGYRWLQGGSKWVKEITGSYEVL